MFTFSFTLQLALIFGAGLLLDVMHARWSTAVVERRRFRAAIISAASTAATIFVWGCILREISEARSLAGSGAYILGASAGSFIGTRR